jgi:CMP-N-acetylneuraminic acid synthetase
VIISTDDKWIISRYKKYCIKRPKKLCGDDSHTIDVIKHAMKKYPEYNTVVTLQPTSPCRLSKDIDRCIDVYNTGKFSSIITATRWLYLQFRLNGAVFVSNKNMILNENLIWNDNVGIVLMPMNRSIDVDTKSDWEIASLYLMRYGRI